MIVSWDWLKEYVPLTMSHDELVERLTMSGLNHESTHRVDGDRAIDLEVTSNRPDCLGHIGIAREISVLFDLPLTLAEPNPKSGREAAESLIQVRIDAPELCPRYTLRVIRGVKIGPSPDWMADRLETLGCNLVNNVVDVTNYVMYETGQPIHAFDYAKVKGRQIIVRDAQPGEEFVAIDHRTYTLQPGMCVIGDAEGAVGLGGVMGGADSEVSESTTDLLIEVAAFSPLSIRSTSRQLNLLSDASHRFERPTDQEQIDWVSRRACQLILDCAGGELAEGWVDAGSPPTPRQSVVLRLDQIPRILGIEIGADEVERILSALGNRVESSSAERLTLTPPSWRHDLAREVDLIEEVARVHGYDQIPEDAAVPMTATIRNDRDRVVDRVRRFMTAAGCDEAITASLVIEKWSNLFSPWTDQSPLQSEQPMLGVLDRAWQNEGQVNLARRSLVPSLLEARRYNEHRSNHDIELFEIARVYLPAGQPLPIERTMVSLVSERSFFSVKGLFESLTQYINPTLRLEAKPCNQPLLDPNQSCLLELNGDCIGYVGAIRADGAKVFKLARPCVVAEFDLGMLEQVALLVPKSQSVSPYPAINRDFNFVVAEQVRWAELAKTVEQAAGSNLERIEYRETFRDESKDGPGKKRLMLTITLRSSEGTLTGDQADTTCQSIIQACQQTHAAQLVA